MAFQTSSELASVCGAMKVEQGACRDERMNEIGSKEKSSKHTFNRVLFLYSLI